MAKYLEESLVDAYCCRLAWTDDLSGHKPMYLFVTNAPFASPLLVRGKLDKSAARKVVEQKLGKCDDATVGYLVEHLRVFIFIDWLQKLVG